MSLQRIKLFATFSSVDTGAKVLDTQTKTQYLRRVCFPKGDLGENLVLATENACLLAQQGAL